MTERKRKEKIFSKIRKKHPDITSTTELNQKAMALEYKRTTWTSVTFLWLCVICSVILCLTGNVDWLQDTFAVFFLFFISMTGEYFLTIVNSVKIQAHYMCVTPKHRGILTGPQIIKSIKNSSKTNDFKLVKASLYDKEDSNDSSIGSFHHNYKLYFNLRNDNTTIGFRVKRSFYLTAPLDAEYILVLSVKGDVMSAYISNAWEIDRELQEKCEFDIDEHNSSIKNLVDSSSSIKPKKEAVVWDILLLIAHISIFFLPPICCVVLPFTTFFVTSFAVKNKNVLTILNVVLGFASLMASVYAVYYFFTLI